MYESYAQQIFKEHVGSDFDYILIGRRKDNDYMGFDYVPHEPRWKTIDEAIRWFFANNWDIVEVYDLYAEFHKSMIRSVSKTKDI